MKLKTQIQPEDPNEIPLTSLLKLAKLTLAIATAAFLYLFMGDVMAAEDPPAKKFEGDSRGFTNPFANPPGSKPGAALFDDEEEEFYDDEEEFDAPPSRTGGSRSGGSTGDSGRGGGKAITMNGAPAPAVTKQEVSALPVDSETAEGSKAVVTDFNFPDADILDIAKALGKLTGKNFIYDKDVKGRVSIVSNSPITVGDAWKAFLTALDMNGFALIPSGKYIRIARNQDARDKQLRTFTGEYAPDTDALITRLIPLKYLNAQEVANTFRSFMPTRARVISYEQTNTIIVTDTGSNITKLAKLIENMDVEGYDAGIEVVQVKHASAVELSKLIDTLIPGTGTSRAGAAGGARSGRFAARRTKEGGIINNIIADERTNTMIIHANAKGVQEVKVLVERLDRKLDLSDQAGKVNVVYLQFGDAEAIASTLNNLSQSSSKGPSGGTGTGTGVNPTQTTLFEGSIKVSPDKATNSLVITASPNDFATVQRVIARLDIPRDQVHAEVIIMEVALNRGFQYSSNFAGVPDAKFPMSLQSNGDLLEWLGSPFAAAGGVINMGIGKTHKYTVAGKPLEVKSLNGLIKAIQTNSNANILATPQILTMDNQEATFETNDKIPVDGGSTLTATGLSQSSIQKENVQLSIKIKPQINRTTNMVTMKILAKLTDVNMADVPSALVGRSVGTTERIADTNVVVSDGDTIVLGGLTKDKVEETTRKIPLLGDIPILGWLFKSRDSKVQKTNMLIFITPKVIRPYEKMRAILDKKLQERDRFIEANMGGEDSSRWYRDEMIRNLPDVSEVGIKNTAGTAVPIAEPAKEPSPSDEVSSEDTSATAPETTSSGTTE